MTSSKFTHKVQSPNKPKICLPPPPPPPPLPPGPPFAPPTFALTSHYLGNQGMGPIDSEATYQMDNSGSGWYWTGWGGTAAGWHTSYNFHADEATHNLAMDFYLYPDDWSWYLSAGITGFALNWGVSTAYYIDSWDYIDPGPEFHTEFTF